MTTEQPHRDAALESTGGPSDVQSVVDTPGALRSEVWLTLQTRHAQQVFTGRQATPEKPYILGLTRVRCNPVPAPGVRRCR